MCHVGPPPPTASCDTHNILHVYYVLEEINKVGLLKSAINYALRRKVEA